MKFWGVVYKSCWSIFSNYTVEKHPNITRGKQKKLTSHHITSIYLYIYIYTCFLIQKPAAQIHLDRCLPFATKDEHEDDDWVKAWDVDFQNGTCVCRKVMSQEFAQQPVGGGGERVRSLSHVPVYVFIVQVLWTFLWLDMCRSGYECFFSLGNDARHESKLGWKWLEHLRNITVLLFGLWRIPRTVWITVDQPWFEFTSKTECVALLVSYVINTSFSSFEFFWRYMDESYQLFIL